MLERLKKAVGNTAWMVSQNSPFLRRKLSGIGLRSRQEWFAGRTAGTFLPDGKRLEPVEIEHSYITFLLHWLGWIAYEPITILLLRELIKDKSSYLHVGANIGYLPLISPAEVRAISGPDDAVDPADRHAAIFDVSPELEHVATVRVNVC